MDKQEGARDGEGSEGSSKKRRTYIGGREEGKKEGKERKGRKERKKERKIV